MKERGGYIQDTRRWLTAAIALLTISQAALAVQEVQSPAQIRQDVARPPASEGTPSGWIPCGLRSGYPLSLSLGQTESGSVNSTGAIAALMLFIDSSASPFNETVQATAERLIPPLTAWFRTESHGVARLEITPLKEWIRIDNSDDLRDLRGVRDSGDLLLKYIKASVARAGQVHPDLDFSPYQFLYIVTSHEFSRSSTHTWKLPPDKDFPSLFIPRLNGKEVRHVVVVDSKTPSATSFPASVHETLHVLGLPDLYREGGGAGVAWDVMGAYVAGLTAWNRAKLGWISRDQVRCLVYGQASVTLTALTKPDGIKAVVLPLTVHSAYVAELRQKFGADTDICGEGLLIYKVDTSLPPEGLSEPQTPMPMEIIGRGADPGSPDNCRAADYAVSDLRQVAPNRFEDSENRVTIEYVATGQGTYRLNVQRGIVDAPPEPRPAEPSGPNAAFSLVKALAGTAAGQAALASLDAELAPRKSQLQADFRRNATRAAEVLETALELRKNLQAAGAQINGDEGFDFTAEWKTLKKNVRKEYQRQWSEIVKAAELLPADLRRWKLSQQSFERDAYELPQKRLAQSMTMVNNAVREYATRMGYVAVFDLSGEMDPNSFGMSFPDITTGVIQQLNSK